MDFFDLLQMLQSKRLRVPSAARFSDRNELFGAFISTMMHPWFSPITPEGVAKYLNQQRLVLESHFVSCWTARQNSIAMWEIYSPHRNGAQIEVDERELVEAFDRHWKAATFASAQSAAPEDDTTFFYPPSINDCIYVDLKTELETVREKTRAMSARAVAEFQQGGAHALGLVLDEQRTAAEEFMPRALFLKDQAFKHEEERRFVLHAMRRNDRAIDECSRDPGFVLFDTHLRPAELRDTDGQIYLDFPLSAVTRIWLDGRAQSWLVDTQKRVLKGFGIEVVQSPAYGSLLEAHPHEKWWD